MFLDPPTKFTVDVPTEDGRTCVVEWEEHRSRTWSLNISEELIQQSPQAVAAVVSLSLVELKDYLNSPMRQWFDPTHRDGGACE